MEGQILLFLIVCSLALANPPPRESKKGDEEEGAKEEMRLKPLNERHHKFPNPALLDKSGSFESAKISRHAFLQQVRRKQNRRRGGKRQKRNKIEGINASKKSEPATTQADSDYLKYAQKELFPMRQTAYW